MEIVYCRDTVISNPQYEQNKFQKTAYIIGNMKSLFIHGRLRTKKKQGDF